MHGWPALSPPARRLFCGELARPGLVEFKVSHGRLIGPGQHPHVRHDARPSLLPAAPSARTRQLSNSQPGVGCSAVGIKHHDGISKSYKIRSTKSGKLYFDAPAELFGYENVDWRDHKKGEKRAA